jgi:hypothetical protein
VNPYQTIADTSATCYDDHGGQRSRKKRQIRALGTAIATALRQALYRRPPESGQAITHHFVHSGSGDNFRQDVPRRPTDHGEVG